MVEIPSIFLRTPVPHVLGKLLAYHVADTGDNAEFLLGGQTIVLIGLIGTAVSRERNETTRVQVYGVPRADEIQGEEKS